MLNKVKIVNAKPLIFLTLNIQPSKNVNVSKKKKKKKKKKI